jgi:hypothetical protein
MPTRTTHLAATALALVALVALAFAGCGDDDDEGSNGSDGSEDSGGSGGAGYGSGDNKVSAKLEPGEYEFYCPVGNHKDEGMEGTLTVN